MALDRAQESSTLIDAHAHLDRVGAIEAVIGRALKAGVGRIVAVGMDYASNRKILDLAARFEPIVCPAIGYHPWLLRPQDVERTVAQIDAHLPACVAMGEVGLDYRVKVKKTLQREVLARLFELARLHAKPVVLHTRFSHQRAHRMAVEAGLDKAVFHWYSGPLEILEQILADGFWVSATPALTYSRPHQEAIRQAPLDRILIETDTPVAYEGLTSEPAHLVLTLQALSRLKGLPERELAMLTAENARRFYNLS